MQRLLLALTLLPALMLPLFGGDEEKVELAEPLAKFAKLLGDWDGAGTVQMQPGMPKMDWTSHGTLSVVLDGKFILNEMELDFGGVIPRIFYRTYYGYDASRDELVCFSVGNTGQMSVSDRAYWADDETLVVVELVEQDGVEMISRSITTFKDGVHRYRWESATGAQPFELMIEGTMQRSETSFQISAEDGANSFMQVPAPAPMQKLARMAGQYVMEGDYHMFPGQPPIPVASNETIKAVFGGHVLMFHSDGIPNPATDNFEYEAFAYMVWDPTRGKFRQFWLNNMGECSSHEHGMVGENLLVSTRARWQLDTPEAVRGTLELDENGVPVRVWMDRLLSTDQPKRAFSGTYKKRSE